MSRSHKERFSWFLLLTAIFVQLCQAYPETSVTQNEEIAEGLVTDVQTLSQIEEDNTDQISEGDLKRQSRKVPCHLHKLKSGLTKAASIPCGAAAGAAAAAIASKSVGGSISGSSTGEAIVRTGSLGGASCGGLVGGSDIVEVRGGANVNHLTDTFSIFNDQILEIGTSLHGALSSMQDVIVKLPDILNYIKTEAEISYASPALRYDAAQTCDNYVQTEKSVSGLINHIYSSLKLPSFKGGQVRVNNNIEIGSCLDKIRANMMNCFATIRSWFSCDKLFSSNKAVSKFQSFINTIPSGSQCSTLNSLGKLSGNYVFVPHVNGEGHITAGGSADLRVGSGHHINEAVIHQQLHEAKTVLRWLEGLSDSMSSLMQEIEGLTEHYNAAQRTPAYVRTIQVPVAPAHHHAPIYPQLVRTESVVSATPAVSTRFNIHTVPKIPVAPPTFYVTPVQQAPVPAPLACSGQSIVDNIYSTVSRSSVIKPTTSHLIGTQVGTINSERSPLDLLNVRINLSRETLYSLLKGHVPAAGDIIILNLTDDVMIVGSPSDDFSPITFNFIYRGITTKTRYNNNILVWNLSEDDFSCNQNIFNDVVSHLIYG